MQIKYKKITKPVLRWFARYIVHILIATLRYNTQYKRPQAGAIIFGLHEECIPHIGHIGILQKQGITHAALTSLHSDGDSIHWLLHKRQITVVRGSSSRGGKEALQHMLRITREQPACHLTIITDGPRGPRRMVKPGVILLAKRSGRPVHLVRFRYTYKQLAKTWDKHRLPYPFSKVNIEYSEPVIIPRNAQLEQIRQQLETLIANTD